MGFDWTPHNRMHNINTEARKLKCSHFARERPAINWGDITAKAEQWLHRRPSANPSCPFSGGAAECRLNNPLAEGILMSVLGFIPLFLLSVALANDPKAEMKAFQGEWRLTRLEADGKQNDPPDGDGPKIVFKGDRLLVDGEEKFTFKLDPSCNPKVIDLISKEDKEQVLEGIYRFDGRKLILCLRGPSRVRMRPVKFVEEESIVIILERVKKE